jgi:acetyltransferase
VVEADDFMQMMDLARTLAMFPEISPGTGNRIAVLTFSGAAGIVSSDFIEKSGLVLADFTQDTLDRLKKVFPDWMPVSNPVDLWPAVEKNGPKAAWEAAFRAVCADQDIDAVFLHMFAGRLGGNLDIAPLVEMAKKAGKPLFGWFLGTQEDIREVRIAGHRSGFPVFREIGRAVDCMAAVLNRKNSNPGKTLSPRTG